MPSRLPRETIRCHVHLYDHDLQRIHAYFGGRLRRAEAIRQIITAGLDALEAKTKQDARPIPQDLDLGDLP